jgi:hypothetical protein
VVSDPGNTIARALGILTQPSAEARAAQLQLGLDLTAVNADGTVALPMPTVVIADASHVVRWIDVHRDYSTAPNRRRSSAPWTSSASEQRQPAHPRKDGT